MGKTLNIALQHSCMFTREGIKSLLADLGSGYPVNIVTEAGYLEINTYRILKTTGIDIFILGMQSAENNPSKILSFIIEWLPVFFPEAKVVIMTPVRSLGWLKDYLLGLSNVYSVLDSAASLQELRAQLKDILLFRQDAMPYRSRAIPLTHQELNVLGFLLKGTSALEIAQELRIHYKTVSNHKRSALHKLGIRSLHTLLTYGNSRDMMHKLQQSAELKYPSGELG